MKQTLTLLIVATSVVLGGRPAHAQALPENLVACAKLTDPAQRLHCYDTQMAGMGVVVATPPAPAAPAVAAPVVPPPAPAPANTVAAPPAVAATASPPPPTPEAKFGAEDLKKSERPKEDKSDKVMEAVIASIREVRPKLFIIVLTNGQIWMQDGTQITAFFKAGYNAHIEKGVFGDFRMSTHETGDKNMVRVTRIQ